MTQTFRCGDEAALITFLYEECEPGEHAAIAAHIAACPRCAAEIESLGGARRLLAAWTPPDARLGFRISSGDADANVADARAAFGARGTGGRGAVTPPWWRQPLPAWAQVAAALLIFAAGAGTGMVQASRQQALVPAPAGADADAALRQNLAALEQRIAGVEQESEARIAAVKATSPGPGAAALMRQVREEIAASERRQNVKLARWSLQMMAEQNEVQARSEERMGTSFNNLAVRVTSAVR